jgi:sulfide dehydrogenase cytochrome subunit
MKQTTLLLAAIALAATGVVHAGPTEDLARSCNACHGMNGVSAGPSMPSIGGQSEAYLKNILLQWKHGERYAATMDRHVKGYSDAELEALAGYFSKLPWAPVVQAADAEQLAHGKEATDRCESCHGATGGAPDEEGTPRLNGQWAKYMLLELEKYREDAVKMPYKKMRANAKKLDADALPAVVHYYAAQPK